jgi:hypothetical protein
VIEFIYGGIGIVTYGVFLLGFAESWECGERVFRYVVKVVLQTMAVDDEIG